MSEPVYIVGAGRTDFQRNFRKEEKTIRHVLLEAAGAALADSDLRPADIQAGIVGSFASGLFTRQLHLGAFLTEVDPALRGIPTFHVEAACASGGVAVLSAAQQISGGIHDVVLVVGAEQQKTMDPSAGADVLAAAADYHLEKPQYGDFMFPKLFARIAEIYGKRHGLTEEQLARVAVKNHAHARLNPQAQKRDSTLTLETALTASQSNPCVAPPLKVSDCSQITDGGAALVLCSGRFLNRLSARKAPRLLGWGHTTDYLPLEKKDAPEFSVGRQAAQRAYAMAGLQPRDIQCAEVHDCFSISELVAYEILGFAESGQGPALLDSGLTALPSIRSALGNLRTLQGRAPLPVNVGGGLMGDGHPVGATGVRQVVEAYRQLTANAGPRQVDGVSRFLTFNMGGSVTTSVVMIWGR